MIMSVRINGQPANLLVDTGSNQLILDTEAAAVIRRHGHRLVVCSTSGPRRFRANPCRLAFVQNMSAGSMNFGSSLVTLRRSSHADAASGAFDGVLGLDILFRHKALINCRTKLVFFKVDQARRINLGSVAASEKFTRVPIQREETGALTVPCSIRGQPTRLLVDTGAFVTILHEGFVKSLGLAAEPTRISAQFGPGASKQISAAKIDDLNIGAFKMPPEKFGVAPLPQFALQQGSSKIAGILGMDTLYICHAIIDLDGMSLFLIAVATTEHTKDRRRGFILRRLIVCGETDNIRDERHKIQESSRTCWLTALRLGTGDSLEFLKRPFGASCFVDSRFFRFRGNHLRGACFPCRRGGLRDEKSAKGELLTAIREILSGNIYVSHDVAMRAFKKSLRRDPNNNSARRVLRLALKNCPTARRTSSFC